MKVVKIGGNIINNDEKLANFLAAFAKLKGPKILIHGGGKTATEVAKNLGLEAKLVGGRRITDKKMLEVVIMVYAGLINKKIVAQLNALHCNAIGLSGADLNLIQAHKRIVKTIDYGFAGDIDYVDGKKINQLISIGTIPVFCAVTHNNKNQLLNTNADTISNEIAKALSKFHKTTLMLVFEKEGVLLNPEDDQSVIPKIDLMRYKKLKSENIITKGMIPKLDNAFDAIHHGVESVRIGSAKMIEKEGIGTVLRK